MHRRVAYLCDLGNKNRIFSVVEAAANSTMITNIFNWNKLINISNPCNSASRLFPHEQFTARQFSRPLGQFSSDHLPIDFLFRIIEFFSIKKQSFYVQYKILTSIAAWIENPFRKTTEHNHRHEYLYFYFLPLEIFPFFIIFK